MLWQKESFSSRMSKCTFHASTIFFYSIFLAIKLDAVPLYSCYDNESLLSLVNFTEKFSIISNLGPSLCLTFCFIFLLVLLVWDKFWIICPNTTGFLQKYPMSMVTYMRSIFGWSSRAWSPALNSREIIKFDTIVLYFLACRITTTCWTVRLLLSSPDFCPQDDIELDLSTFLGWSREYVSLFCCNAHEQSLSRSRVVPPRDHPQSFVLGSLQFLHLGLW